MWKKLCDDNFKRYGNRKIVHLLPHLVRVLVLSFIHSLVCLCVATRVCARLWYIHVAMYWIRMQKSSRAARSGSKSNGDICQDRAKKVLALQRKERKKKEANLLEKKGRLAGDGTEKVVRSFRRAKSQVEIDSKLLLWEFYKVVTC